MSNPEGQLSRAAVGIELLTAWSDPNSTTLVRNSLTQIFEKDGGSGLVNAVMGVLDVAALLLLLQREATGNPINTILQDLARKIQPPGAQ
jgi:hypothetical protein